MPFYSRHNNRVANNIINRLIAVCCVCIASLSPVSHQAGFYRFLQLLLHLNLCLTGKAHWSNNSSRSVFFVSRVLYREKVKGIFLTSRSQPRMPDIVMIHSFYCLWKAHVELKMCKLKQLLIPWYLLSQWGFTRFHTKHF